MKKIKLEISKKSIIRAVFLILFVVTGITFTSGRVRAPENTEIKEPVNMPQKVYEEEIQSPELPVGISEQVEVLLPQNMPEHKKSFSPQMPVQGEIIRPFSGNELIYSKTTGDYRTHQGVDIACEILGRVYACDDGVVESVSSDELMGITIRISHTDGFVSLYSNLSTDKMVTEGQTVTKGQIISGVGDTALLETGEEGHLHFEILKDEVPQNPEIYLTQV